MEMRETDELAQPVVPVEAPEPVAAESVEATVTSEAPAPAEAEEVTSEKVAAPATKDELMALMETLVAAPLEEAGKADAAHLKQMFYNFRKAELDAELADFLANGGELNAFVPAVNADEERFKEMLATLRERRAELTAAHEAELKANLEAKKKLIDELKAISEDTDNVNRAFPRVKDIQAEFKAIGEVPPTEATDIWKQFQQAVEQFYDQLKVNKDLRDYDFRKNLELKTLLCEEAEKLDAEEDVILAFKRLQNLHDEWRQAGPVAKELREEIWQRFKDASAVVNKRYQAFFEERKAREQANETAKTELCEKVEAIDLEALKSYALWDEATKQVLALQEQWKKLGYAPRKSNNALFARFRKACDTFFTRKGEYFHAVKDELAANLAKKEALCEQAEALKDSTDWRRTADKLVALQKEWKTIGAVAKKQSDAVWKRFQTACDAFFENRKKNLSDSRSEEQANLKAKREIIEALKAIPADTPRQEAMPKVKELQARWQEIGHVPFKEKDKVYDEYRALCDAFYARLRAERGGMSRFEDVVNEMGDDTAKLRRERDRIVRACEIKRNELKTYENNLGFLSSKSKSGDSVVRVMERRIQRIKDDLAATEEKIRLLDSKL